MPYMTDMRHFLCVLDPNRAEKLPAPAKRLAHFHGAVVEGVTAGWDDPREGCAVIARCPGRIGRRRGTDNVVARIVEGRSTDDAGNQITAEIVEWTCVVCGEHGEIHHWQDTPWNLTDQGNHLFSALDVMAELELTPEEHEAVASISVLDASAHRVLAAGRQPWENVVIAAPGGWLEHLVEFIASEANHARSKKKVALYEAVLDRAEGVV